MNPRQETSLESEAQFPAGLKEALRAHAEPPFGVPSALDSSVRAAARRHFGQRRALRLLRWWAPAAAAAAAILLFVLLPYSKPRPPSVWTAPGLSLSGAGGRVTILDAFALARRLKSSEAPSPEWDYNSDGIVDRRDVDALAAAAVRLEDGT